MECTRYKEILSSLTQQAHPISHLYFLFPKKMFWNISCHPSTPHPLSLKILFQRVWNDQSYKLLLLEVSHFHENRHNHEAGGFKK